MEGPQADGSITPSTSFSSPTPSAFPVGPPGSQAFSTAITEWQEALGPENVLCDQATLDRYARSTLPVSTRARAVLRPGSTDEVRRVVRIAAKHRTPLYPISCGKNWGYGDACAPTDGQVIVDLSRMNRIVEVDPDLAYAVIEPGVTQQQMCDYLRDHQYPLWLDATGAGPEASIVGNTLERGFGHTPYGNHFQHMSGMEVVLADGRVLNTGFGAYENAKAAHVFPGGIGPWLDGLFTQSNMGIVTRMTIWLLPAPPVCQAFAFKVPRDDQLEAVVEALRPLRLHEVVRSTVHVANDLRVLSARRQYPWDLTGGVTPLPDDVRARLRKEAGLGAWNVMGGLYGTVETVAAARSVVRHALRGVAHVHFFGPRKLALGLRLARLIERLGVGKEFAETIYSAESVYHLLVGRPSVEHLKGVFWRTRTRPDAARPDPIDSGVTWLSPVLPMTGSAAREMMNLVEPIFAEYGFEALVTMTSVTSRALVCVMSICYDKQDAEETARAAQCYESLSQATAERGYVPYRSGIESMAKLSRQSSTFWDIAARVKQVLDAPGLLAPGRYAPPVPMGDGER